MSMLPGQTPGFHLHSISIPTSQEAIKQHELLIREWVSNLLDVWKDDVSVTINFTFEGQHYRGIAYPMKEEQ